MQAAQNSLLLAIGSTLLVVPLAFAFAWALVRTCAPMRPLFRQVALVPLLAPSLMPAISLIYLFGNQGLLKDWMGGAGIYGFAGMLAGEVFYTFPHALMIILTAYASTEFTWKDALLNALILTVASYLIFIFGLQLTIPVWPV